MTPASVGFQCPECVREGRAGIRAPRGGGLRTAAGRWGPVTVALIAVNVAMFVITAISAALAGNNPLDNFDSPVAHALAQVPLLVQDGEWWRVFTAAFVHIGLLHIGLNMLALLIFGSELERALGRWRFLGLYVVSILGGALAIQMFSAPDVPAAGASTAIYGLLGGMAVLLVAGRQSLRGLSTLLVINLLISLLIPNISWVGHLGGLVGGALAVAVLVLTRGRQRLQVTGVIALGVVLFALALVVPTIAQPTLPALLPGLGF
jgi:membrane associated rhomboid family serine protease